MNSFSPRHFRLFSSVSAKRTYTSIDQNSEHSPSSSSSSHCRSISSSVYARSVTNCSLSLYLSMLYSFRASFYLLFSFNIWQSLIDWNMQHWNLYVVNSSIPKSKLGSMTYLFVCVCEFCAIYYTYLYYSYSIDSICSHWFVFFFFLCDFPLILLLCIDLACILSFSRARSFFYTISILYCAYIYTFQARFFSFSVCLC